MSRGRQTEWKKANKNGRRTADWHDVGRLAGGEQIGRSQTGYREAVRR